jgi:virulence-associated protein VagC
MAKVFKSGNSQAVRIPKDLRFDSDMVEIIKDGDNLVIKPIKKSQSITDKYLGYFKTNQSDINDLIADSEIFYE